MNPNLKKIRDSVIDHTLKLDDDRLALLLLIQLSRHQNLFIHEPSDWNDSPTDWITQDQRIQDEVIAILSFIILFSFTNAYRDKNLFKEHRNEILAMHPEDFLNNSIYQSAFNEFIEKKITIKSLSNHFKIPRESIRRYVNLVLNSGLIVRNPKYGYLVNFDAYKAYIFTNSLNNIFKSIMRSLNDFIVNLEDYFGINFNLRPLTSINTKKFSQSKWNRVRLHLYHFWVRILTLEGSDHSLLPADRIILSAAVYFKNRRGILKYRSIEELYENEYLLPTNLSSISEAAKMPRETVRRCSKKLIKLNHLEKKGRNIYRVNYPKLNGEVDIFLKFKELTFTEMMNFYFNIYEDLAN
tara:strand:+ start:42 stop:1103 length:1062 start_codon:yes stop_codon:yes gene_type:complete